MKNGLIFIYRKILAFWIGLGNILGMIMSTILLSLIYFLLIGPLSIISKLFRADFLHLKGEKSSYWRDEKKEHLETLDDLQLPF